MKVGVFLLGLIAALIPARAGLSNEVWIALRTDGRTGAGTIADPYDGSTEARFDALMGRAGTLTHQPCRIHLGAGTFVTRGVVLDLNSQLLGCGIDQTILQLQSGAASTGRKTELMQIIHNTATGYDTTSVSDLTVDGNIAGQPQAPHDVCISSGVVASHISRVKVINLGTTLRPDSTSMESFWIIANSHNPDGTHLPAYNQVVEDSICVAPTTPMYVTFFGCWGQNSSPEAADHAALRNVVVRNCKVVCTTPTGTFDGHAFTFANCDSAILEDCYTDGITHGYYQDTWSAKKIAIRNNVFSRVTFGVYFNGPGNSAVIDGLDVEGNLFDLAPNRNGPENANGVRLYGTIARFVSITNNRIRLIPGVTTVGATDGGIELRSGPTPIIQLNTTVRDNIIDIYPVENRFITQNGMKAITSNFENNGDSYGENVLGDRYERLTFTTLARSWYCLWSRVLSATTHAGMTGLVTVRTRTLLGSGSVTLSTGGTASVALPTVTPHSRIVFKLATASGTPGAAVYPILRPGDGFTIKSTNVSDRSTYTYTVDTGNESNTCCFTVSTQPHATSILTQLYAGNSDMNPTETSCTGIKTYDSADRQTLWGNISGPSIVTVDVVPGTDLSPLEDEALRTGTPERGTAGSGSLPVTTLTLDSAAGLVSTGPILAPNLPLPARSQVRSGGHGANGN